MGVIRKSVVKSTRISCNTCKDSLIDLKQGLVEKGSKLTRLQRKVAQVSGEQDEVDQIFKRTNLAETRLKGLLNPRLLA
jgi:hypothetical protein